MATRVNDITRSDAPENPMLAGERDHRITALGVVLLVLLALALLTVARIAGKG